MKMRARSRINESCVSEVIGFMIILALMITGIALVTLYGYPVLLKEQASANIRNMEKNLIVIQTDLNSLSFRNVPYKETSLQVSGGTLSLRKEPDTSPSAAYFTITYTDSAGNPTSLPPFYPGNLKFQSADGQADIVLENGAVHINYWSDREGSSMLSEPRWYYDKSTSTLVIPLVRLNATEDMSQMGMGVIRMQLAEPPSDMPPINKTSHFTIAYKPDPENNYRFAWKNYLLNDLGLVEDPPGSYVFTNSSPLDTIIIRQYNVTILSL
jgi:hypothetical protein